MKKQGQLRITLLLVFVLALTINCSFGQTNTWDGSASTNWNNAANWSLNIVPTAAHDVVIPNNFNVTVNTAAVCNSFTINPGAQANSITISLANSLTVTNGISIGAGTGAGDHKLINVGTGSLTCGSVTVAATGNANRNSGITLSTGTVTVNGNITMNDANDVVTFTGAGTLNITGTMSGGTFTRSTGTVNYNNSGAQTVGTYIYNNLILSGSGVKTTTGVTVNGILSMEGTATASVAPTYGAAATLQYNTAASRTAGVEWITPFAATGGVIIANTGVITLNAAKVFNASVPFTINNGASLNTSAANNYAITFGGNYINNGGTLTANASNITIASTMAAQSIAGFTTTGTVSMTKTAGTATLTGDVNGNALTLNGIGGTLNLGTGLTHTFTGNWTNTNGTLNGGSSTLMLGNNGTFSGGTFTAGTGTVNYYAAGVQTVGGVTYNNLILSGSGVKTTTGVTVNGILSMEGTATASVAPTYGAAATLQYNTAASRTAGVEWITPFAATGGVIIANTGVITLNAAKVFNASVPFTINNGASLNTSAANNYAITFGGNYINNGGTLTANASNITIASTMAAQSIAGFTTTGTVSMTKTAGTATLTGDVNGNALTLNGIGGTLNLGTGLTHTFTGNWTNTNGTLNAGSGTLRLGANGTFTGGTFTAGTGTVNYYAAGAQTVAGVTYNNLTLSGSGAKTVTGATINGILSMEGTATTTGSTPTFGAGSTINYMGSSAQNTGIELPATFNGSGGVIINNSNGLTLSGNVTISALLTMTQGNVNTGSNTLTLSNNLATSLVYTSGTIIGKIRRAVSTTTGNNYLFPVGTAGFYRPAVFNFSSISGTTDITAEFIATPPAGFTGYTDGGTPLNNTFTEGYWRFSSSGLPTVSYTLTLTGNGFTSYTLNEVTRITGRDNTNGTWRALGTHGSQSGNDVSRTGVSNLNTTSFDFALANGCGNISMGYGYERDITVDYTKVSGGEDLFSFPMLVNLSGQTFLKTSPTGQITSVSGYDIIFTDNNYNKLDHQLEYYNGTNGDLIAWVRIPVLSSSANTVIKIMYGNSQVTTDLSVTSVWDSHYKGIWHLDNNTLGDFTSYNKAGTPYNSPTYPAGQISTSLGLDGTNQYVEVLNDPNINFAGNITVSAWVYMSTGGRDQKIASNQNNSSGGYKFGVYTNNKVEFEIRNSANTPSLNRNEAGGTVLNTGQWYYLAGMSSDVLDSIKTFVNGIPERPFKKTGTLGIASDNLVVSKEPFAPSFYFAGQFDELRISDKVRSNGWLRTEYNNHYSPSTFYTVSAEAISYNVFSAGICNSPFTLTFGYPSGGTYSGNTYISGNIFTPPSAGTYPITYTYNGGCGSSSITKDIIITPVPSAPVASNEVYCTGQIANLEATTGQNIKWYSGATLVSTANPYSTGITTPGTYNYTVTQTVNGCESPATSVTLTILTGTTIITHPQPTTTCVGSNATFNVVATGYNMTYQWQEGGVDIVNGGIYSGATTATLTLTDPGAAKNGASYRCRIFTPCGTSPVTSNSAILTVIPATVATFSYTGTPYCPNAADPSPTFSGGGVAGTFSSTAGLVFVSTATGQINIAASTPGSYTVTNTIAASGNCFAVIATSPFTITTDLTWTGTISTDWNNAGNWTCSFLPTSLMNVQVPNVANKPVLSTGSTGKVNNLTINAGSSLTISGNTIQVSGSITNNGTFTAAGGTVELNGSSAQIIGAGIFAGNTINNLIINNITGVSLLGTLNITGIANVQTGNLASDGYLVLQSGATQTALIDGSGTGQITGNVIMERYLPSSFGYKYLSSPFQAAFVSELGDDMNLGAAFPSVYKYDESRLSSGWVSYVNPLNLLNPMQGYSVNFYSSPVVPNTVDITGPVNDGPLSITLYNNDRTYTKGFNLVGNPYPSPINWNAGAGWTKTNIDNALYFFKASLTDQYGGTYSSYVNGISSDGIANAIIPSMQGFFVHVSDGAFPVTGTLGFSNSVRVTNLAPPFFKSAKASPVQFVRITATFSDDQASEDPAVVYFDDYGTENMDHMLDALKLFNTDLKIPNIYSVTSTAIKLSISALPPITSSSYQVPLGVKANRDGTVVIKLKDVAEGLAAGGIFLSDSITGAKQDLLGGNQYSVYLATGEYLNRFWLNFGSLTTGLSDNRRSEKMFTVYSSGGNIKAIVTRLAGDKGEIVINNILGQKVFSQKIYETGSYEFSPSINGGIYIVTLISGNERYSQKLFIGGR